MEFIRRILIVEDQLDVWGEHLAKLFPPQDWKIIYASTVAEAKREFEKRVDWDLLVVDYELPDGTGKEFLEFARSIDDNIPVFLFSQYTDGRGFAASAIGDFNAISFLKKESLLTDAKRVAKNTMTRYERYMAEMCSPSVQSEYGKLRTVLVHEPSEEVERLDPTCLPMYLVESPPPLRLASQQHRGFIAKIKKNCKRPIVLEVAHLLYDVLKQNDGESRKQIIENILFSHEIRLVKRRFGEHVVFSPALAKAVDDISSRMPEEITRVLLRGLNTAEFPEMTPNPAMLTDRSFQVVEPVPNLYFMRDPCFVLGSSLVLSRMYWPIRRREPAILREVLKQHPFMAEARKNLVDWDDDVEPFFSVEGGDAMAIAPGEYAIALSERTSRQAVRRVAEELLNRGAKRVLQPTIPVKRAFIHLDTVCSLAGPDHVLIHPDATDAYAETYSWTRDTLNSEPISLKKNFIKVLEEEFGKKTVKTGGALEQFDDAANVFMVRPDTAIAYDRNVKTNKALRQERIKVVTFHGSDLVVGRGGARCMTMPLRRD